jgi:ABC-type branched-subunit amino acid transport system substrate-binding protein
MGAVALSLALLGAACSDRSTSTTTAKSSSDASTAGSTASSSAAAAKGSFGDLGEVCGTGSASGSTDVGVTKDGIRVATLSDAGFSGNPGLNKELFEAADAFVGWCNEAGGILGRKIQLDKRDAKLTEYQPRIIESCSQDLALVGSGGIQDFSGAQDRVSCGMPEFNAFTAGPQAQDAQLLYAVLPNPTNQFNPGPPLKVLSGKFPGSFDAVGVLYDASIGPELGERIKTGVAGMGGKVVFNQTFASTGEASWAPFIQSMKSSGVRLLFWIGDERNAAALIQSMSDQSFKLDAFLTSPNLYTDSFQKLAGANAGSVFVYSQTVPFEEAKPGTAIQEYLDILKTQVPAAKPTALGVQAFSAWLLWAKSAKACGSDLTRKCLADQGSKVIEWKGGGLQASADPGHNKVSECAIILGMTSSGYKRFAPDAGFACDPTNTVSLPGLGLGAKAP